MASKIEIINLALGRIGQGTIGSLSEDSVQAAVAGRIYESCLKECLRGNNWSFAQVSEPLALVANYTPVNWTYAYQYPTSCMVLWKLYVVGSPREGDHFQELFVPALNQKVIGSNTQFANGEYTFYVQDTSLYDSSFVNVFAYRLAADMAMPLNADAEQAKNMMAIFSNQMSEAQRLSSYEQDPTYVRDVSPYVDARGSGSSNQIQPIGGPGGTSFITWNNS